MIGDLAEVYSDYCQRPLDDKKEKISTRSEEWAYAPFLFFMIFVPFGVRRMSVSPILAISPSIFVT